MITYVDGLWWGWDRDSEAILVLLDLLMVLHDTYHYIDLDEGVEGTGFDGHPPFSMTGSSQY